MKQDPAHANYEMQSASLLAAQPPTTTKAPTRGKDWNRIIAHLDGMFQGLRMWRYSWWIYWQELARFILPRRYKWLVTANTMWRGSPINGAIVDGTGTKAMQTCAAGMWTGLTSPSRPWFKMGIGLPWIVLDKDGKEWLKDTEEKIYTVLAQSNFYNQMAQFFQDVTTFGTAPIIVYEDVEDIARFYLPCAGEYYLGAGSRLSVDTFVREFTYTIAQCVGMFGLQNCPPDIQLAWQEGGAAWSGEVVVCHAIEPNAALSPYGKMKGEVQVVPPAFTYREVYWLRGNTKDGELSRRGFHEKCFAVGRWSQVSNDPYGRSPGMDALPDIKQLQLQTLRKAEFVEKLVRPPMGADVAMKNEPSSIIPGHVTYTDSTEGRKGFWPLFQVQPQALAPMVDDIAKVQERIKEFFFVNLFMAISQMEGVQPRNELELTKRDLERLQELGPFINMFEQEVADPIIFRVLKILERRRLLKPMPQSLRNVPLKIKYISIMRLAQRSAESVALKDFLATGGQMSAAAKAAGLPDPLRKINLDKALQEYADLSSVNPDLIYTDDEVAKHDAERAKNLQQEQAMKATTAGVQAAKTLSDTQLGGNTGLSAMLGGGSGTGA